MMWKRILSFCFWRLIWSITHSHRIHRILWVTLLMVINGEFPIFLFSVIIDWSFIYISRCDYIRYWVIPDFALKTIYTLFVLLSVLPNVVYCECCSASPQWWQWWCDWFSFPDVCCKIILILNIFYWDEVLADIKKMLTNSLSVQANYIIFHSSFSRPIPWSFLKENYVSFTSFK